MSLRRSILGLIMLIAIVFAAWNTSLFYAKQPAVVQETPASFPDAFMEDVKATIMDIQGKPKLKISTPKMVHYLENDSSHLTTPSITLYRNSPKPWYITAKHALATNGIEHVDFWDHVLIHHAADENAPATVVNTNTLTVFPNKKIAETKDLIILVQPDLVVKAIGLYADMNNGDIKLLSQTRGEYVPSS